MSILNFNGNIRFLSNCYNNKYNLEFWKNNYKDKYTYYSLQDINEKIKNLNLNRYQEFKIFYLKYDDDKFYSVKVISNKNNEEELLNLLKELNYCVIEKKTNNYYIVKTLLKNDLVTKLKDNNFKLEEINENIIKIFFY